MKNSFIEYILKKIRKIFKVIGTAIKAISTMIIVFITPFILPSILKLLINNNFFENIEEFNETIKIFYNPYSIIYIVITIILLLWFFHKWEDIKKFIDSHDFFLNIGGKQFSTNKRVEEELKDSNDKIGIIKEINVDSKETDSANTIKEMKNQLGLIENKTKDIKCKECNKEELETENSNLRYYAAYNLINLETKSLLHVIYNEKYIEFDKFKKEIIEGYKKRNKHNRKFSKQDIDKIADSKYETIYEGLKFLNIIEPSEDDKELKLTKEGKAFVEKYIEKREVV